MNALRYVQEYTQSAVKLNEFIAQLPDNFVSSRVILAWEKGGLFIPAWQENGELARSWINVAAHNAAVGLFVLRFSWHIGHYLEMEGYKLEEVVEAALVHDSFKRREQEHKDLAAKEGRDVNAAEQEAEYESDQFLKDLGFGERIVLLAGSTGYKGRKLVAPPSKVLIAQKLVFYADCCVSNGKIVGYQKRFDDLLPEFQPGGRYEDSNKDYLKEFGKTHREVWDETVLPIQNELARLAQFYGKPEDLYTLCLK